MKYASIDIGTNTVLLLIADIDPESGELLSEQNYYRMPRLGYQLTKTGLISEEKIESLIKILFEYNNIAKIEGVQLILTSATYAFRMASNRAEIVKKVFERTGIIIEIISGDKEAELSFLGAIGTNSTSMNAVIDIGGGSTEIIIGTNTLKNFSQSFNFGVVNFSDRFSDNNLISGINIFELERTVRKELSEIPGDYNNLRLISLAGTPTTLSAIAQNMKKYFENKIEGSVLTLQNIKEIIGVLKLMKPSEIGLTFGEVVQGREDVILTGSIILMAILEKLNADMTYVSSKGLRYGMIYDHIKRDINQ